METIITLSAYFSMVRSYDIAGSQPTFTFLVIWRLSCFFFSPLCRKKMQVSWSQQGRCGCHLALPHSIYLLSISTQLISSSLRRVLIFAVFPLSFVTSKFHFSLNSLAFPALSHSLPDVAHSPLKDFTSWWQHYHSNLLTNKPPLTQQKHAHTNSARTSSYTHPLRRLSEVLLPHWPQYITSLAIEQILPF